MVGLKKTPTFALNKKHLLDMNKLSTLLVAGMAFAFTACAASDNDPMADSSSASSILSLQNVYGTLCASSSEVGTAYAEMPALAPAEAGRILEAFRRHTGWKEQLEVDRAEATDGEMYRIGMTQTVAGGYGLDITLRIFEDMEGVNYYLGYEAASRHASMAWQVKGFSIEGGATAGEYTFTATGYIYLKVAGEDVQLMKTPLKVTGTYEVDTHRAGFHYSL